MTDIYAPDKLETERKWEGKYKVEGKTLVLYLKCEDLERAGGLLEKLSGMDEGTRAEISLDSLALPGFKDDDHDPWLRFYLERNMSGAYLRCELYAGWDDCEWDSFNCAEGPGQILYWCPDLPEGFPYDWIGFRTAKNGMGFCHIDTEGSTGIDPCRMAEMEGGRMGKKLLLKDTPHGMEGHGHSKIGEHEGRREGGPPAGCGSAQRVRPRHLSRCQDRKEL